MVSSGDHQVKQFFFFEQTLVEAITSYSKPMHGINNYVLLR